MNILFLTVSIIDDINKRGIYTDLLRYFINQGHKVYIVSPTERRFKKKTHLIKKENHSILKVRTLNIQKTNFIEKGIGTILLEYQFNKAIKKHFKNIYFDLILYSTPPITLTTVIKKIKNKNKAKTYLLLKDIFPQNAVDIELMSNKGLLYNFFRNKEKKLYKLSDYIGCMSPANVNYVIKHNPEVDKELVEVCPNSIELKENNIIKNKDILKKYNVPEDSLTFIYGGNLGKPQGLDFLLEVLDSNNNKNDRFFIIVGSGTEYNKIDLWFKENKPKNAILLSALPKEDYDNLVQSCDVGIIFLDPRFTIPNYPSRLLSYLEYKMPVIMATDVNTDIGKIAEENGYGVWTENGNLQEFNILLDNFCNKTYSIEDMGNKGYNYLKDNYTIEDCYKIIMKHFIEK